MQLIEVSADGSSEAAGIRRKLSSTHNTSVEDRLNSLGWIVMFSPDILNLTRG